MISDWGFDVDAMRERFAKIEAAGPYPCARDCGDAARRYPGELCPACETRETRRRNWDNATSSRDGIPERFRWAALYGRDGRTPDGRSLDDIAGRGAVSAAWSTLDDLAAGKTRIVLLMGPTSAGKSTLAAALLGEILQRGGKGEWISVVRLADARREAPLGCEPEIMAAARRRRWVVLDDIGQGGAACDSPLNDILHARYDACLPIIATTGFDRSWIAEHYGAQFARRLFEEAAIVRLHQGGRAAAAVKDAKAS
jgi:hypothetical protein